MRNAQPTAIELMRAARQERLKLPAAPEDVAVMTDILSDLPPAHRAALHAYYAENVDGPQAATRHGLSAEEFCLIRASVRKTFFVLTQRLAR
jgi:hypothetical protein